MLILLIAGAVAFTWLSERSFRKGKDFFWNAILAFVFLVSVSLFIQIMNDRIKNVIDPEALQEKIHILEHEEQDIMKMKEKFFYTDEISGEKLELLKHYFEIKNKLIDLEKQKAELSRDKFLIYFGH